MKQKFIFFTVMMMALALPQVASAEDFTFSYQGQTLCYDTNSRGEAGVTY